MRIEWNELLEFLDAWNRNRVYSVVDIQNKMGLLIPGDSPHFHAHNFISNTRTYQHGAKFQQKLDPS